MVAASIVCISLQLQRHSGASVQLSSSLSLLFGMIKVQGTMNLELGRPKCDHITGSCNTGPGEELRISCPPDLKQHIVRFLEAQAATNPTLAAVPAPAPAPSGQQLGLEKPAIAAAAAATTSSACAAAEEPVLAPAAALPATPSYPPVLPDGSAAPLPDFSEGAGAPSAAVDVGCDAASVSASISAAEVAQRTSKDATDNAGGGAGGAFAGACSTSGRAPGTVALTSVEALLGHTPAPLQGSYTSGGAAVCPEGATEQAASPHGASGAGQEAGAASIGPQPVHTLGAAAATKFPLHAQQHPAEQTHPSAGSPASGRYLASLGPLASEPPVLVDYAALMSYAATYRSSTAPAVGAAAGVAHGSVPVHFGSAVTQGSVLGPSLGSSVAAGGRHVGSPAVRRSPDSILGLRGVGLEGWTEGTRAWERMHSEE